jgi:Fe-S oxidoreductase
LPGEARAWQDIFTHFGAKLDIQNAGCCGMAGTYGHLEEHQETSAYLFNTHWAPKLDDAVVLATGFSCRSQAAHQANKTLVHPIELVNQWVTEGITHDER